MGKTEKDGERQKKTDRDRECVVFHSAEKAMKQNLCVVKNTMLKGIILKIVIGTSLLKEKWQSELCSPS